MRGRRRGAAIIAALLLCAPPDVRAEGGGRVDDVTLTAAGGGLAVSGTLRAYDGVVYRVETVYGLLTLDASAVTCDGPGCPDLLRFVPRLTVAGEAWPAGPLVAALAADYAAATGSPIDRRDTADGGYTLTLGPVGGGPAEARARPAASRAGDGPTIGAALAEIRFLPVPDADAVLDALDSGAADLAVVATDPGAAEGRVLALDALLPVAWPGNPVRRVALRDLRAVQAGAITTWADLGGPDMPVVVHALAGGMGLQRMIDARLGGPPPRGAVRHATPAALAAAVTRDPWALALVPASQAGGLAPLTLADSCGHVIRATRFAVKAEDYPLAAAIHLIAPRRRLPSVARALIDHAATPSAQSALAAAGFADLAPEAQPVSDQGGRLVNAIRAAGPETPLDELQRLAETLAGAERLSLTFRFEGGARDFDAVSRTHLTDLARLIEAGLLDGRTVVFAGFSDGDGDARANLALSRSRAEAAQAAVAAAAPLRDPGRVALATEAFGEALPIACDDTPVGRQINRRVEVWLRPFTDTLRTGN